MLANKVSSISKQVHGCHQAPVCLLSSNIVSNHYLNFCPPPYPPPVSLDPLPIPGHTSVSITSNRCFGGSLVHSRCLSGKARPRASTRHWSETGCWLEEGEVIGVTDRSHGAWWFLSAEAKGEAKGPTKRTKWFKGRNFDKAEGKIARNSLNQSPLTWQTKMSESDYNEGVESGWQLRNISGLGQNGEGKIFSQF